MKASVAWRCLLTCLFLTFLTMAADASVAPRTTVKVEQKGEQKVEQKVEQKKETASREEFRRLMAKMLQDQAFLNQNNPFPTTSKMHPLFQSFMLDVMTDPLVLDFLLATAEDNAGHVTDYEAFGKALGGEYAVRGLTRLSEDDFRELLRVMGVLAEKLPPRDCASMLRPGGAFKYEWLEQLPEQDARSYLGLTRKALLAEIAKTPRVPNNTNEQKTIAYQALFAELKRLLPPEKLQAFGKIWGQPEVAGDGELCWGYRVLISGIIDLPVEPRRWMLREYANILRPR
jgi:hypothetical protein